MLLSATTFVYMIRLLKGRTQILRHNNEMYWFFGLVVAATSLLTLYLVELSGELPDHDMLRTAAFQTVSIITTTGYASANFDLWLPPAKMLMIILMFIGGCSGSTAGGVKVVRIVVALHAVRRSILHAFRPNITMPMRLGGKVLSEQTIQSVIIFLMLMVTLQITSMLCRRIWVRPLSRRIIYTKVVALNSMNAIAIHSSVGLLNSSKLPAAVLKPPVAIVVMA